MIQFRPGKRRGIVLLATLVVIVLLSLAAYHFSDLSVSEYKTAEYAHEQVQAKAIADSGIHYALAMLSNADTMTNTLNGNPFYQPTLFADVDVPGTLGKGGKFTLIAPPFQNADGSYSETVQRNGVIDEGGKINVNAFMVIDPTGQTLLNLLTNLSANVPNMNQNVAAAIVDWVDGDDMPLPGGAESATYAGLSKPYGCKNGPLDSLEELSLVQGVTPQILYGNDRNRNGLLEDSENDGNPFNQGLYGYLTIHSRELLVNPQGQPMVYLNDGNLQNLYTNLQNITGISPDLAKFIVIYRQYGPYSSNSSSGSGGSSPGTGGLTGGASGAGGAGGTGGKSTSPTGGGKGTGGTSGTGSGGKGGGAFSGTGGSGSKGASTPSGTKGTVPAIMPSSTPSSGQAQVGVLANLTLNSLASQTNNTSNQLTSIFQLVGAQVQIPATQASAGTPATQATTYNSPIADVNSATTYLPILYQYATTYNGTERPARININTASPAVVTALLQTVSPNITQATINNVLSGQPQYASGSVTTAVTQTPVWLYTQAGISPNTMQQLDQYITTASQVYRVQSVGTLHGGSKMTARVEAVIDVNGGSPRILAWRDLTDLGRGSSDSKK